MNASQTLSVLMPNYNHARFLPMALEAILTQSRPADEIIVIDDASTDNSLEVLETFARRHPNFTIIRNEENLGVVKNMNRLTDLCRTSHAAFLAADDLILPGMFERSMTLLAAHPQAGLCSGLTRRLGQEGQDLGELVTPVIADSPCYISPENAARFLFQEGQWIINNTSVYRVGALHQAGGFQEDLLAFSDGLISDVVALRHGACYIPDDLAYWRESPQGFASRSCTDLELITGIMRRAIELMRTRYADVFSPAYRERFRKHLCKRYNSGICIEDAGEGLVPPPLQDKGIRHA